MTELDVLLKAMEMSRNRLEATLDALASHPGWSPEVLRLRGRADGPHIGWHLGHIACIEDLWAHQYFQGRSPRRPDLVERFFRGTAATEEVPPAVELIEYLGSARRDLMAAARGLETLEHPCEMSDGRILPARDILSLAAVHESIHHGRIAALYFDTLVGREVSCAR